MLGTQCRHLFFALPFFGLFRLMRVINDDFEYMCFFRSNPKVNTIYVYRLYSLSKSGSQRGERPQTGPNSFSIRARKS